MLHEKKHDGREYEKAQTPDGNRFVGRRDVGMPEHHEDAGGNEDDQGKHARRFCDHQRGPGFAEWHAPVDLEQPCLDRLPT